VTQTVKRKNGDRLETIPRENLWLAHTPQAFRTELIKQAHATAHARGILGTDDAALVERLGYPVAIVPDDDTNIKITSPADLEIAGALYRLLSGRDRLRRDETAAEAR
jgi:2-C-methyl-D-erythritol 4-phosphate cytidylyltransferase